MTPLGEDLTVAYRDGDRAFRQNTQQMLESGESLVSVMVLQVAEGDGAHFDAGLTADGLALLLRCDQQDMGVFWESRASQLLEMFSK